MKINFFYYIIILTLFACSSSRRGEAQQSVSFKPIPYEQYTEKPNLSRDIKAAFPHDIKLVSTDKMVVSSEDVFRKGDKPLVLSFWLTTCAPCLIEFQEMSKKYPNWKNDFRFVAVSTDFIHNMPRVWEIYDQNKYPFEVYWDMNREFRRVMQGGLNGLPQVFLFDKDGKVAYHKKGFFTGDAEKLHAQAKALLPSFQ